MNYETSWSISRTASAIVTLNRPEKLNAMNRRLVQRAAATR